MFSSKLTRAVALGLAAVVVAGVAYGIVSATTSSSSAASTTSTSQVGSSPRTEPALGGASNARSGPAAGGTTGTVASLSKPSFTVSTSAGQSVTVHEAPSTTYEKGTSSTSASAVTT